MLAVAPALVDRALVAAFPDWSWFGDRNIEKLRELFVEHVQLTLLPMLFGVMIAVPLAVLAVRRRRLYGPLLGLTGVLFTIPSAALFILLLAYSPFDQPLGIGTSLIGLTIYTLLILFRNTVAGLDGVPPDVLEAADAMGFRPLRRLWAVEAPLSLPVFVAGVRIAAVTTIGMVTVTAFIGQGGLGQLFITGFQRRNATEVAVGILACVVLAVVVDLLLVAAERVLTPWSRTAGG